MVSAGQQLARAKEDQDAKRVYALCELVLRAVRERAEALNGDETTETELVFSPDLRIDPDDARLTDDLALELLVEGLLLVHVQCGESWKWRVSSQIT